MKNFLRKILDHPAIIKLMHWEYWSFGMVYTWIYPVWIYYCFRAGSLFFFAPSNPTIKNGGFLSESKKDIHPLIPANYSPKTIFFDKRTSSNDVLKALNLQQFTFPLIGKPDIGGRGRGVKKLLSEKDVREYGELALMDYHIQEFVPYPKEVGIFYYRLPDEHHGKISGVVRKEFLSVTGDGESTIKELLLKSKRAILQKKSLDLLLGPQLNTILNKDEKRELVPYGNHARGAMFIDDSALVDSALEQVIDSVCRQIPGFYFGRLDIRYRSWNELKQGEHFSIIEVNGAGSEPTHIYDPRHSLFFAWKEIIRHWDILFKISMANHRKGHPFLSFREGIQMFKEDKACSELLARMPE